MSLVLEGVSFDALKNIENSMNYGFELLHSKANYLSMLQEGIQTNIIIILEMFVHVTNWGLNYCFKFNKIFDFVFKN